MIYHPVDRPGLEEIGAVLESSGQAVGLFTHVERYVKGRSPAVGVEGLEVCLIPHTLARTNLGDLAIGDAVNVENDLVGKYVERLLGPRSGVSWDLLRKTGFLDG